MKAPVSPESAPLYEYTLMPQHMNEEFSVQELKTAQMHPGFTFTKGCPVLHIDVGRRNFTFGDLLYDLEKDPGQLQPIENGEVKAYLIKLLAAQMKQNDAPAEQFVRLGMEDWISE